MKQKKNINFIEKLFVRFNVLKYGFTDFRKCIKFNVRLNTYQKYLINCYLNKLLLNKRFVHRVVYKHRKEVKNENI